MPAPYIKRGWAGERDGGGLGIHLGRVNHYAVRSVEGFMIKRDRGDVNPGRNHVKLVGTGVEYWKLHDWNYVEDVRIQRHLAATRAKMDDLKAIGRVGAVHDTGVAWHRARAAALSQREDMAGLRSELVALSARERPFDIGKLRQPEPEPT